MSNWCGHPESIYPRMCRSNNVVSDGSDCQNTCTGFDWCVGYSYKESMSKYCVLYPNVDSCPNGWNYDNTGKSLAKYASDLTDSGTDGGGCFAKRGKIYKSVTHETQRIIAINQY